MLEMVKAMGRLGTESAFEVLARADELTLQGKDIINLGIGQPDFKTPEHIVVGFAEVYGGIVEFGEGVSKRGCRLGEGGQGCTES